MRRDQAFGCRCANAQSGVRPWARGKRYRIEVRHPHSRLAQHFLDVHMKLFGMLKTLRIQRSFFGDAAVSFHVRYITAARGGFQ